MAAHTRVYIESSDLAVLRLSCPALKVLMYLTNRADEIGSCYPKQETIHAAMGGDGDFRNIPRLLAELESGGWIGYRRRNQVDPITRKKLPNVYMVNPEYLCIAEAHQAEAAREWSRIGGRSIFANPYDSGVTLTNNNNQHQETNTRKPAPVTNNNNQQTTENGVSTAPTAKAAKNAAEKTEKRPQAAEPTNQSAALQILPPSSAAPPANRLPNPASIPHALPDTDREKLAARLREFGIPMPMARGFVVEYSVLLIEQAYTQTCAALDTGSITKPGGFFRMVLQERLVDPGVEALPGGDDGKRYTTGKYADIIAS